jgi:hypothetical protein
MKIAFTICSNNYLAQASILMESLLKHARDYKLYVCLCDKKMAYSVIEGVEIIEAKEILGESFFELIEKYNIIELNTSVKASMFKYLFEKFDADLIYYFDPDIKVFNDIFLLENEFPSDCEFMLTPHILKPVSIDEKYSPNENLFLNHGVFNLGFLGLRGHSRQVSEFLDWWEERLMTNCFSNLRQGYFVDQLWINLVPIYFKNVYVSKNKGNNVAPWNLHERELFFNKTKEEFMSGTQSPLIFFHFSNYNYLHKNLITPKYTRVNLDSSKNLVHIYNDYYLDLIRNRVEFFSKQKCHYYPQQVANTKDKWLLTLKKTIGALIPPVINGGVRFLLNKSSLLK